MALNNVDLITYLNLMPKVKSVIVVLTFVSMAFWNQAAAFTPVIPDSVGLETRDGQTYVLHKVAPGETLYSLSRRYNSPVSGILKSNPGAESGIKIEQVLRIPYEKAPALAKGAVNHVVKASETMYAISRKYNVKLSEIKKWNNLKGTELSVGQTLVIYPKGDQKNSSQAPVTAVASPGEGDRIHTVASAETVYSISRKYNVSMADIRKWNNLDDFSLNVGQKLVIKSSNQPAATGKPVKESKRPVEKSRKPVEKSEKEAAPVSAETSGDQAGNSGYKEYQTSMEEIKRVNTSKSKPRARNNNTGFSKVVELGFAEVIKTDSESKKWLALHRTAPGGTIVRVKNEMNNLWVFVRVVGVLPETSVNDKVLIKISQTAYDKLGAINDRFPVEISYVP